MKNAGMAGAVALVGIGLLSIGLSNFTNRAEAVPSAAEQPQGPQTFGGKETSCVTHPEEQWFDFPGEALCAVNFNFLVNVEQGDINGDGIPDRFTQTNRQWNGGWEQEPDTGAYSYSYDGESVSLSFTPVAIDWESVLGNPGGNIVSVIVSKLADIDGDGRRDLIVARQELGKQTFTWHRNITTGNPLVADINRDGFVNAQDLGLLIAAWTG